MRTLLPIPPPLGAGVPIYAARTGVLLELKLFRVDARRGGHDAGGGQRERMRNSTSCP